MIDLKTLIRKTSVNPELQQLKMSVRNNQKKGTLEEFFSVLTEITD